MKKVIIASKNPVKINAVTEGFKKMFPGEEFDFLGISVPSEVSSQPLSDEETFLGAKNRVKNGMKQVPDVDFYVGVEGGVQEEEQEMEAFAWVYIQAGNKIGKARTGTFFLPHKVILLLKEGKELGEADDSVFKYHNSKQQVGAVGILTGGLIDRTKYYTETVILALIPFKNPELY